MNFCLLNLSCRYPNSYPIGCVLNCCSIRHGNRGNSYRHHIRIHIRRIHSTRDRTIPRSTMVSTNSRNTRDSSFHTTHRTHKTMDHTSDCRTRDCNNLRKTRDHTRDSKQIPTPFRSRCWCSNHDCCNHHKAHRSHRQSLHRHP